jgi:hypothetical protein
MDSLHVRGSSMRDVGLLSRWLALAVLSGHVFSLVAEAQVYKLAELNIEQIRKLNRQETVILLPGGILEEHGPYICRRIQTAT